MVAVATEPPRSVTLTTKVLVPRSESCGVPESAPSAATVSQLGPLILANVSVSPLLRSGSVALVAMLAEYASSTLALASLNGFRIKDGGGFELTISLIVAEAETPLESVRATTKTLVPMTEFG